MKKAYEELETEEDLKVRGLRRIKRRFQPKPGETASIVYQVISEIKIDADLHNYLETESKNRKQDSIEILLNNILREVIEKRKLSDELLNDSVFVSKLREKLAA